MGYLPDIYKDFRKNYPDQATAYAQLASACNEWGPIDERARHLIRLGVAIGMNSDGGVRSHARQALEAGISIEEVRHTVFLSLTSAGFTNMAAAMKWVEEVIENFSPVEASV